MVGIVWLFTGIPIMLDCSSNGLVARMLYGPQLLKIEPWKGDLAAPMLAHALGGSGHTGLIYGGPLFCGPVNPGRDGLHHERQCHRDVINSGRPRHRTKVCSSWDTS